MKWACNYLEVLLFYYVLFIIIGNVSTIKWLALREFNISAHHASPCRSAPGLSGRQVALCRASLETMPHVARAAQSTVTACQELLRDHRWNCSSVRNVPHLGPDLARGTREQAFVYALSSAAVTFAIARACASGDLFHCTCAPPPGEPPNGHFKWGGCADNVKWGSQYAKQFLDTTERVHVLVLTGKRRDKNHKRAFKDKFGKMAVVDETSTERSAPNEDETIMRDGLVISRSETSLDGVVDVTLTRHETKRNSRKHHKIKNDSQMTKFHTQLAAMNLHNNKVGRRAVQQSLSTTCKCHGVSGSCSVKTCWRALGHLRVAGDRLLRRLDQALHVAPKRIGTATRLSGAPPASGPPGGTQLVFLTRSSDYCKPEPALGSAGTTGRTCSVGAPGGENGSPESTCRHLCCGRGYNTVVEEKVERCHCKYYWCCYVKCKTCVTTTQRHECN